MERAERVAALHGLYYCTAKKTGSINSATNHEPWKKYEPLKAWLTGLYDSHKLTHEEYIALSAQFRTGHSKRKRDVLELQRDELERAVRDHVKMVQQALETEDPLLAPRRFPTAERFISSFSFAARRRRIYVIIGGTHSGKSLFGHYMLLEIGKILGVDSFLEVTVEDDAKLDFSGFDIRRHAGVQLDGVGDACILWRNREVLQGRPKECKGGRSATMVYSYPYTLASRAVIVTMDLSARNLDMFRTNHWLSDPANCEVLRLTGPAYVAPSASVARAAVAPRDAMAAWSVRELHDFLQDQDLAGPAAHLQSQGCSGGDFLSLTPRDFERDLKLTRFAARKLVAARDRFLAQPAQ